MNDARCSIDATGLGRIERIERQSRRWRLVALICASVLGAVLIMGQSGPSRAEAEAEDTPAPEAGSAVTPTWEYEVIRFPARPPFKIKEDVTRYLTDELNAGAANGWEYVGLCALESQTAGYNGVVAFRRETEEKE